MRTSERNVGVLGLRGDGVQRIESCGEGGWVRV